MSIQGTRVLEAFATLIVVTFTSFLIHPLGGYHNGVFQNVHNPSDTSIRGGGGSLTTQIRARVRFDLHLMGVAELLQQSLNPMKQTV